MQDYEALAKRLLAGTSSDADCRHLREALVSGNLVHVAGDRNVAVGGDAPGALIVTGDHARILQIDFDAAAVQLLYQKLFPTPGGLPPPFPELMFVGREGAIADVKALLHEWRTAIVHGWPGVGKTTLVGVLSRDQDIVQAYPDGVLWTSLDQSPSLLSILAGWSRAIGGDDLLASMTADDAALQLQASLRNKRMLLIVDDVWNVEHGALFGKARSSKCGLLYTTRLPAVGEALTTHPATLYRLQVLQQSEALRLMTILAPQVVAENPHDSAELVRDLECLPLAIHVAARLLRAEMRLGWGISDLLAEIREGAALIRSAAPADRMEDGKIPTVDALLHKSTRILDEHTRECFAILGVFAPKPATFAVEALRAVWQVEDPRPIVRKLVDRGLLEPVGNRRYQMHAILVAHARSLLS